MTAPIPGGRACAAALLEVPSDTSTDPAAGQELHQQRALRPQDRTGQGTQALLSPCPRARAAGLSLHPGIQSVHIREFREMFHIPVRSHLSKEEDK